MRSGTKCGSNQSPPGRRPNDKYPVNTSHRSVLRKNVSLQCYLVATVIYLQSVRSQICIYMYTHSSLYRDVGRAKKNKNFGTAVNEASKRNLTACHIGHASHCFGRPALVYIWDSSESDYRNYIVGLLRITLGGSRPTNWSRL